MGHQTYRMRPDRADKHTLLLQQCTVRRCIGTISHRKMTMFVCNFVGLISALLSLQRPRRAAAHWHGLRTNASASREERSARPRPEHRPAAFLRPAPCDGCAPARSPFVLPTSIEPTGAPRPFDRQNITVSKPLVSFATLIPSAVAALKTRAPSRCTGRPALRASRHISSNTGSGVTVPPAMLCVFSRQISAVCAR